MNTDRRVLGQVCIELIKECAEIGEMSDSSHDALATALKTMRSAETWSLKNQERHAGKNQSTDTSIAISRVALPALEAADAALHDEDYQEVIVQLDLAITTDGTKPKRRRK